MKNAELFTTISSVFIALFGASKLYIGNVFNYKSHKRNRLIKIMEEAERFSMPESFRDELKDLYKQQAIFEITGINTLPENYELIRNHPVLENYPDGRLRALLPYLRFYNDRITVRILRIDKIAFVYTLSAAILLVFASIYMYVFAFTHDPFKGDFWVFSLFSVLLLATACFLTLRVIIPYKAAKKLKLKLKLDNGNYVSPQAEAAVSFLKENHEN